MIYTYIHIHNMMISIYDIYIWYLYMISTYDIYIWYLWYSILISFILFHVPSIFSLCIFSHVAGEPPRGQEPGLILSGTGTSPENMAFYGTVAPFLISLRILAFWWCEMMMSKCFRKMNCRPIFRWAEDSPLVEMFGTLASCPQVDMEIEVGSLRRSHSCPAKQTIGAGNLGLRGRADAALDMTWAYVWKWLVYQ